MLLGELGYKPAEAYDLLHCELELALAGFRERVQRERHHMAWLAASIELAHRSETIPQPWELLGEDDPNAARRERRRAEEEQEAHRMLGMASGGVETPAQVLARFGIGG